jgi:hypothetical protein
LSNDVFESPNDQPNVGEFWSNYLIYKFNGVLIFNLSTQYIAMLDFFQLSKYKETITIFIPTYNLNIKILTIIQSYEYYNSTSCSVNFYPIKGVCIRRLSIESLCFAFNDVTKDIEPCFSKFETFKSDYDRLNYESDLYIKVEIRSM